MKGIGVLSLAMLVMAAGCDMGPPKKEEEAKVDEAPPLSVEGVVVSSSPLSRRVAASGTVSGTREAYVTSQTQGIIKRVSFRLGQWVKKGQVLVAVDSVLQQAAYEQAQRSAESAEITLRAARKLYDQGNASDAELKQAQMQASGAHTALEKAQKGLSDTRLTAPISGYIAERPSTIQQGNTMSPGTPVTRIVNLSSLKTQVAVGEMDVGLLRAGLVAEVHVPAAGDTVFTGKITAIGAGADASSGAYPVEVVWRNAPDRRVKSGMSARVRIDTDVADSVVMVPSLAIVEVKGKQAAFTAAAGASALQFVELGRMSGTMVEVAEGLEVGDTLLTSGITTLASGDRVAVTLSRTLVEAPDERR